MIRTRFYWFIPLYFILQGSLVLAQSKANDIGVENLPASVKTCLELYVDVLRNAPNLDSCAQAFTVLAGGSLVEEDGEALRKTVQPYSLKKDFANISFYAYPLHITRVNVQEARSSGFGASAIRGTLYKIWIAKKQGQPGLPAPISILLPEGQGVKPKVVGIGSL